MTSQPLPEPLPHVGPVLDDRHRRARFDPHELAIVLTHYEVGVIERIRAYPRGSRRAPKVRIKTRDGEFLLKRRAPGRDDPYRVAFAQSLQLHLYDRGYPVPALIGTRDGNNSMLELQGRIYELFEYASGVRYDGSPASTEAVGNALGAMHRLLEGYQPPYEPPAGSFHGAAGIDTRLARIPAAVAVLEPAADRDELARACDVLRKAYNLAADQVEKTGFRGWPRGIIHGDWHPGNLLFGDGVVMAVLDFDSARREPRMSDIANAALQFSMILSAPERPESWPEGLDFERIRQLIRGYEKGACLRLNADELAAMPWLMVEALVLESVVPIAATGSFGRISGSSFLRMVEGKVGWIAPRAERLIRFVQE